MVIKNSHIRHPAGRGSRGFTLIELMITVAIIGILASIAYPGYQRYVQDARRAEAKSALLEVAGAMERCRSANFTYENCAAADQVVTSRNADLDFYVLSIDGDAVSRNAFQVAATPNGPQASDRCGTLTLGADGERGGADDNCW